jgi:rod shape determining protein RodA
MTTETRSEQFQPPSIIGNILRKLHIDIPLFICLFLISLLSFVILYSAGSQNLDVLMRQAARVGLAFLLMTVLAHVILSGLNAIRRYFSVWVFLLVAVLILGYRHAHAWIRDFRFQPQK